MHLNSTLITLLEPAFGPCPAFGQKCVSMRWDPESGHVPRGFLGACGEISEVEMVLVFSEPGDPHPGEKHSGLESAYSYATLAFQTGKDQFHRNVRSILDMCYPSLSFDDQMRKVWMTDAVLCSAKREGGSVPRAVSNECGNRYLKAQVECFSDALVVALGKKAQQRLRAVDITNILSVDAAAPPGCNRPGAYLSWQQIPEKLHLRRESRT